MQLSPSDLRNIADDLENLNKIESIAGGKIPVWDALGEPAGNFEWASNYATWVYVGGEHATE